MTCGTGRWLAVCACFFNDTATTEIYTLSLHDALPISWRIMPRQRSRFSGSRIRSRVGRDRKSTRLNSSHLGISYAVFCLQKKKLTEAERGGVDEYRRPARETRTTLAQ